MGSYRSNAVVAGALFLIAMIASLTGGAMVESVLGGADYLAGAANRAGEMNVGVALELVNLIAVVGIAAALFPLFRRHSEGTALAYLGVRILEAVSLLAAAFLPLSVVSLSRARAGASAADAPSLQVLGDQLVAMRAGLTGTLVPLFFVLGALLLYTWLYRSRVVPRFIALWGLIAALLIIPVNLLDVGMPTMALLALPIILNEVFLGIWLIARGFEANAIGSALR